MEILCAEAGLLTFRPGQGQAGERIHLLLNYLIYHSSLLLQAPRPAPCGLKLVGGAMNKQTSTPIPHFQHEMNDVHVLSMLGLGPWA